MDNSEDKVPELIIGYVPRLKILTGPWLIAICFAVHCNSLSLFLMTTSYSD